MNKRITSLFLCLITVFSLLTTALSATAVPADLISTEDPITVKITTDKATANRGDTIEYTVSVGPIKRWQSANFTLVIPEGLTYVSGAEITGLVDKLGAEKAKYTESTKTLVIYGGGSYNSTVSTDIMKFSCTVNSDVPIGTILKIAFEGDEAFQDDTYKYYSTTYDFDSSKITVVAAPKPATGITLDKTSTKIYTGSDETLTATLTPADTTDTVTWESNNPGVASVDNDGKVTAVAPGTAKITAKAGSVSASCTVTVENAPCTHAHKKHHAAKKSTCTEKGYDEYYECEDCGKILTDDGKVPFLALKDHEEGTAADCQHKAVCRVCGNSYGNLGSHKYTSDTKKAEALKTAGTCKDEAVYWYSCSVCGDVEHNDSHTFKGDKNPSNHTGGTHLEGKVEATCKNEGYSGDTHCLGCNAKLSNGSVTPKTAHNPSSDWSYNETEHWKECTNTVGCGVKLSKEEHKSTGDNKANCQHKNICDVCGEEYGSVGSHSYSTEWSSDDTNHWHVCTVCGDKKNNESHTPDRTEPTETDPVKCSTCGHIITPELGHIHRMTKFDAKAATHTTDGNIEYYKCEGCGKLFADIDGNNELTAAQTVTKAAGHNYEWKIDKEATATEKGSKHEECTVCGDKKAAVEIPALGTSAETSKTNGDKSPKTGDGRNLTLLFALLFVSGGAATGTVVYSRKRKNEK